APDGRYLPHGALAGHPGLADPLRLAVDALPRVLERDGACRGPRLPHRGPFAGAGGGSRRGGGGPGAGLFRAVASGPGTPAGGSVGHAPRRGDASRSLTSGFRYLSTWTGFLDTFGCRPGHPTSANHRGPNA